MLREGVVLYVFTAPQRLNPFRKKLLRDILDRDTAECSLCFVWNWKGGDIEPSRENYHGQAQQDGVTYWGSWARQSPQALPR